MVAAVEAREAQPILRHVAPGFRGGLSGREADLDYAAAQAVVLEFLLRDHPISARLEDLRIGPERPDGTRRVRAEVWFAPSAALAASSRPRPASAVGYRFDLRMGRGAGTWWATRAEYTPLAKR